MIFILCKILTSLEEVAILINFSLPTIICLGYYEANNGNDAWLSQRLEHIYQPNMLVTRGPFEHLHIARYLPSVNRQ